MAKKSIQDLAVEENPTGVPDKVKEAVDNGIKGLAKKLWHKVQQVTPGILIGMAAVAAIALIGGAMVFGNGAALGEITRNAGTIAATTEKGISFGLEHGLRFLSMPPGWAALAVGAVIGGTVDYLRQTKASDVAAAEQKAAELAKARAQAREPGQERQQERGDGTTPEEHPMYDADVDTRHGLGNMPPVQPQRNNSPNQQQGR